MSFFFYEKHVVLCSEYLLNTGSTEEEQLHNEMHNFNSSYKSKRGNTN
jgi:hypothetical protein